MPRGEVEQHRADDGRAAEAEARGRRARQGRRTPTPPSAAVPAIGADARPTGGRRARARKRRLLPRSTNTVRPAGLRASLQTSRRLARRTPRESQARSRPDRRLHRFGDARASRKSPRTSPRSRGTLVEARCSTVGTIPRNVDKTVAASNRGRGVVGGRTKTECGQRRIASARHRRVDAEPARGVVRGRNDARPMGLAADDQPDARAARIIEAPRPPHRTRRWRDGRRALARPFEQSGSVDADDAVGRRAGRGIGSARWQSGRRQVGAQEESRRARIEWSDMDRRARERTEEVERGGDEKSVGGIVAGKRPRGSGSTGG